ncbi:DUF960 domain-containing protein [Lactococcus nasutitermitis]|uniref:DUF960 domain-containing protein n=1 Tax=Lactococcus nasutitermitis TaxID=1652957 RepID=A0ABV9JFB7_9LACT|nr:DUF960 domain-containing protein [Lactococcus nasutitermitis]
MAFTNTTGRYATFGTISTIPGEIIDSFWYIIDQHLKGVLPLDDLLNFELLNHNGFLSIRFSQENNPVEITIDFKYPFNNTWPRLFYAVDNKGRETIMVPKEL